MKYVELYKCVGNSYTVNYNDITKKVIFDVSHIDTFQVAQYNLSYSGKYNYIYRLLVILKTPQKDWAYFYGLPSERERDIKDLYEELLLKVNDNSSELIIKRDKKVYKCKKEKYNAKQTKSEPKLRRRTKDNINMVSWETILKHHSIDSPITNYFISPELRLLLKRDADNF